MNKNSVFCLVFRKINLKKARWITTFLLFSYIPFFISKLFAYIFFYFSKEKQLKKINIVKKGIYKTNRNLINLDFNGAIGDVIILSRFLKILDDTGTKNVDILCPNKFKEYFQKLQFKNLNFIFFDIKTSHYYQDTYNNIDNLLKSVKNEINELPEYNNFFSFGRQFILSVNLYSLFLKYNKLTIFEILPKFVIIDRIPLLSKSAVVFMSKITSISMACFNIINKKKYNINFFGNKNECKNLFMADFAYYAYFQQLPKQSLSSLEFSKYFKPIKNNSKSLIIMVDDARQGKRLKVDSLIKFINENFVNYKVTFVGDGPKFIEELINKKNQCKFTIINKVNKTKTLMDLINEVNKNKNVLAYDTSILHIAMILNKKTKFIANKKNDTYVKGKMYWHGYKNDNLEVVEMDTVDFY